MPADQQQPRGDPEEGASVARLFALVAGAALVIGGVAGFFYEPSFGTGTGFKADDVLGTFPTNGWDNLLQVLAGLAGLIAASRAPRPYALILGTAFVLLAIWGSSVVDGSATIADLLPVGDADNLLHLAVGVAGIGAGLADGGWSYLSGRAEGLAARLRRRRATRSGRGDGPRGRRRSAGGSGAAKAG
jgi:hypothetical protein